MPPSRGATVRARFRASELRARTGGNYYNAGSKVPFEDITIGKARMSASPSGDQSERVAMLKKHGMDLKCDLAHSAPNKISLWGVYPGES